MIHISRRELLSSIHTCTLSLPIVCPVYTYRYLICQKKNCLKLKDSDANENSADTGTPRAERRNPDTGKSSEDRKNSNNTKSRGDRRKADKENTREDRRNDDKENK